VSKKCETYTNLLFLAFHGWFASGDGGVTLLRSGKRSLPPVAGNGENKCPVAGKGENKWPETVKTKELAAP
jgi:hypothetical protein